MGKKNPALGKIDPLGTEHTNSMKIQIEAENCLQQTYSVNIIFMTYDSNKGALILKLHPEMGRC